MRARQIPSRGGRFVLEPIFPAVLEYVPEHPIYGRDVNSWAHSNIFGRVRCGSRHPRVDDDEIRAVELLALENVLQRNRMRLGGIAAMSRMVLELRMSL
jgi:hypothetical protein